MAIIAELVINGGKIYVHDDEIRSPEEQEEIRKRAARIVINDLLSREVRKKRGEKEGK